MITLLRSSTNSVPSQKKPSKRHMGMLSLVILFSTLVTSSCQNEENATPATPQFKTVDTYDAEVATKWSTLQLKLISTTAGFSPPVASRALGYAGVTLYESVVSGMPQNRSLLGQLNGLNALPRTETNKEYNWAISANAGQAYILKNLFANTSAANKTTIDSLETAMNTALKTAEVNPETFGRSVTFGQEIAKAIFEWSKTDNGHEGYTRNQPKEFTPPIGPGMWVQTAAGDAGRALQPYWGQVRPFLVANSAVALPKPIPFSNDISSSFFALGKEVYDVSKRLSDEQKAIALFWADGGNTISPPGHSYSIATIALKQTNAKLDKAAEAYAKVGMAVADAFICCWKCKYEFNLLRPITYIRATIDPLWSPLIATPPFPEHLSGHSTQSGASAQVLTDLFGTQFAFTDDSHKARGLKERKFSTFFEAADEAAISRLYGGIHYSHANVTGLDAGKKIGANVNALKFKK